MATRPISPQDHDRIAAAIRAAESKTDGEIYCVVAHASAAISSCCLHGDARHGHRQSGRRLQVGGLWLSIRLPHFVIAQLLALGSGSFSCRRCPAHPSCRGGCAAGSARLRSAVPRPQLHRTSARTGVLVFVSIAERYAEVIADSGIDAHVGQHVWDGVVRDLTAHAGDDRLADGFVKAIVTVGSVLAEHFPVSVGDSNELDDHLVEI
jgi:putative membrane protein